MNPSASISNLKGVGSYYASRLSKVDVKTLSDLLYYFPFRYEDFSKVVKISELKEAQPATIIAKVDKVSLWRSPRKKIFVFAASISDDSGKAKAVWFNQPFLTKNIKEGFYYAFAGKAKKDGKIFVWQNPAYEAVGGKEIADLKHTARLVPVYPETRGLTSKAIRLFIKTLFSNLTPRDIKEFLPQEILKKENLPGIFESFLKIHFPDNLNQAQSARERFAFENVFLFQIRVIQEKLALAKEKAPQVKTDINLTKEFLSSLSFKLTDSQRKASWEILKDLGAPKPMSRLLQGDVGSGKTLVAQIAALNVVRAGYQVAFMAPTEILAKQHFERLTKDFSKIDITCGLLTYSLAEISFASGVSPKPKKELQELIKVGKIDIVLGTHALISKDTYFSKVGLVIIDEQHRFGVEQRGELMKRSINLKEKLLPHFISMSATPIPRSLALTLYGDLDISLLPQKPPGRQEIETKVINQRALPQIYDFIKAQIKLGRQAFIVYSRVEAKDDEETYGFETQEEIKAVKKEYECLKGGSFKDFRVGILYGKMKAKEKEKVMAKMAQGEIDVLISSSVVEVGVDIPNASVILIESAEKFGLAQLHQFRGRVGRSNFKAYCFLLPQKPTRLAMERLRALEKSQDGFYLAQKDLQLRGPGQFFGQRQSGLPDIAMRSLHNLELIKKAREDAALVLKKSPGLSIYPLLRQKLSQIKDKVLLG